MESRLITITASPAVVPVATRTTGERVLYIDSPPPIFLAMVVRMMGYVSFGLRCFLPRSCSRSGGASAFHATHVAIYWRLCCGFLDSSYPCRLRYSLEDDYLLFGERGQGRGRSGSLRLLLVHPPDASPTFLGAPSRSPAWLPDPSTR